MTEQKPDRTATFQAIESTMSILGDSWKKHWSKVLKPEVIQGFITWLAGKKSEEDKTDN